MTLRQAAGRLKHAALVLAGYRPAEVRFDEGDRAIAQNLAREWAETYFHASFPRGIGGPRADVEEVVFNAICEYAYREREGHRAEQARRQREREDRRSEVPF